MGSGYLHYPQKLKQKIFALIDCNNFYASCQRVFSPQLAKKPVVVLSNNDGCIIARSNEAKQLGIKMGEPAFKITNLLKEHNVAIFSSNFALYGDFSERVVNTLKQFTPDIEIYSIDESFLDLSGFKHVDLNQYAGIIRQAVIKHTGIPVSIGVAPTKTLAKIANRIAKKSRDGVCVLTNDRDTQLALIKTEVKNIWGIGRQYTKLLQANGIESAWQLKDVPDRWARKHMTVVGERLVNELRGASCLPLEMVAPPKKAIMTSRSFGEAIDSFDGLQEAISTFASNCAAKLRQQNCCAKMIAVFIQTNGFQQSKPQYCNYRITELPVATNNTLEMIQYALKILKAIYRTGYEYKRGGVMVTNIVPQNQVQMNLFDTFAAIDRSKSDKLMSALDSLNKKMGRNTLKFAVQGFENKWWMRQNRLSPCYTTRWEDLLRVKA